MECQWRKRKSNASLSNQAVSELFPLPKIYCTLILSRTPIHADHSALYEDRKKYGLLTGFCWILSPEPPVSTKLAILFVKEFFYSDKFLRVRAIQELLDFLFRSSKLDEVKVIRISELAKDTILLFIL